MLDSIGSQRDMIQQTMQRRGSRFGARKNVQTEGQTANVHNKENRKARFRSTHNSDNATEANTKFQAKYNRELPDLKNIRKGMGKRLEKSEQVPKPQLSTADGLRRRPKSGIENNPQMQAAMEALRKILNSPEITEEEKQTEIKGWAEAYNIPEPQPGTNWFWER